MAWCPKCKRDYIEEILECKECGIQLIDGVSDDFELLMSDKNDENIYTIFNYLNDTTNYTVELFDNEENGTYDIYTLKEDIDNVKKALILFLEEELKDSNEELEELVESLEEEVNNQPASATYVSAKDKYEEAQSSAFSMIFVGAIGMAFMILKFNGISFISFSGLSDILFNVTMTTVFGLFLIVGFLTYQSARRIKAKIIVEESLIDDLKVFFDEKITAEAIDNECNFTDETEEIKYFTRQECIKEKIYNEFEINDDSLVEQMIDEYYPLIFNNEE